MKVCETENCESDISHYGRNKKTCEDCTKEKNFIESRERYRAQKLAQIARVRVIRSVVAEYFGISEEIICSRKKGRVISRPRQLAQYISREEGIKIAYIAIACNKDRSTVQEGLKSIKKTLEEDTHLAMDHKIITDQLEGIKCTNKI